MTDDKPVDRSPAISLLDGVPQLEAEMVASWLRPGAAPLKPLSWEDSGASVLLPNWETMCRQNSGPLRSVTVETLCQTVGLLHEFAKKTAAWGPQVPSEALRNYAIGLLGAALACALHRQGWEIVNFPGSLFLRRGEARLNPFELIEQMRSKKFTDEKWHKMMADLQLDPQMGLGLHTSV